MSRKVKLSINMEIEYETEAENHLILTKGAVDAQKGIESVKKYFRGFENVKIESSYQLKEIDNEVL